MAGNERPGNRERTDGGRKVVDLCKVSTCHDLESPGERSLSEELCRLVCPVVMSVGACLDYIN